MAGAPVTLLSNIVGLHMLSTSSDGSPFIQYRIMVNIHNIISSRSLHQHADVILNKDLMYSEVI